MNRRKYLQKIFAKSTKAQSTSVIMSPLDPYMGEWTPTQAAHLLRRTTFSCNRDTIQEVVDNGLAFTVDQLLADKPMPDPPINYADDEDPNVPIGSTWVGQVYSDQNNGNRNRSLRAWTLNLILEEEIHLREKMTLFWHNHLVTDGVNDARMKYQYISLLRENALGNFKSLIEKITIDPTMLRYLNGNSNRVGSPNENYARELLELFTLGKGLQVEEGDYTNYTEADIAEIAKALTGWMSRGNNSRDIAIPYSEYIDNRHDKTTKTLSPRLGSAVINNSSADEYKEVINIIFQQEEVSKFICRKLYRYFLQETISPSTEIQVIEPLAELLRMNGYEIKPVLRTLLSSEHFYDVSCIGAMIKNPIEHIASILHSTKTTIPQDDVTKYEFGNYFFIRARNMQMEYFSPPNVAGWKAYYQAPAYYRLWISSVTLPERIDLTDDLVLRRVTRNNIRLSIDPLAYVDAIPTDISTDVNLLLNDLASSFFCQPLDPTQLLALKDVLLPGLPDMEWNMEYGNYLNPDTTSDELQRAIQNKLKDLFRAMMTMPEFFLC